MSLRNYLIRAVPESLFWRLVTVWVLCFVAFRLFSMVDLSMRSDAVFLRIMAGTEARYMALHMRLMARESHKVRTELVRQLGRDRELWVNQVNTRPDLPDEDSELSKEMARQVHVFLAKAGLPMLSVRASMLVGPRGTLPTPFNIRPGSRNDPVPPEKSRGMMLLGEGKAALAQAAVEYAPGEWLHLAHHVDVLPEAVLYLSMVRVLTESVVMIVLALTTLFWIVRPLQTLARATESFGMNMDTPPLPEDEGSSEIRNAAKAFNSMRARLVAFVRGRNTMLAAVSHDLRTPLTRMRLRLENAQDEHLRTALLADVDEVQKSLEQIIGMVRTLNAADPEEPDRVDFMALMESMVEDMQDMGQAVTLEGDVPGSYWLPPTLATRCIQNIISNAVRYGESARVLVSLADGMLRVEVLDNGPGIPEDLQELVFEPFYRLEDSRNLKTGGYGLGLAISRALARLCGGDIAFANRSEGGLAVTITLAAKPVTN